jgi:prefoldin subunit 5
MLYSIQRSIRTSLTWARSLHIYLELKILDESVNTLDESVNTLDESVNTLDESVNTLDESVTLDESLKRLW